MRFTARRKIFSGLLVFFFLVSVNSLIIEPNTIEENTLRITNTGIDMDIVFVSDFQRNNSNPDFVQKVVDIINSKNPDLVLLGGDYVENSADELPSIYPLQNIQSKHGVYGVMGNHDYSAFGFAKDVGGDQILSEKIIQFMANFDSGSMGEENEKPNITILRNEKVIIDDDLTVIGLDDLWAHLRDESKAFSDKESHGYRILLSHNQEELEINKETADLFLFGHTHCGQIRLPVLGSIPKLFGFSGDYDKGHYLVDDVHVYTTCGLAPAPRLLNPPEIVTIKLVS